MKLINCLAKSLILLIANYFVKQTNCNTPIFNINDGRIGQVYQIVYQVIK